MLLYMLSSLQCLVPTMPLLKQLSVLCIIHQPFLHTRQCQATLLTSCYCCPAEDTQIIPTPLPPSEVIYFLNSKDSQGNILDASTGSNYTITFDLPVPARAFWSLIIYNATK